MAKIARNPATTAVYLVLEKDGKVLLGRRCNTGYQDGNYQVPAGHIDAGELPTEALIREVQEEIGVVLTKENLQFVHASFRPKHDLTGDRVDYFFRAKIWEGEIVNKEPEKCDDLCFFGYDEFPENTTPHVRVALECIRRGEYFSEMNLDFLRTTGMYRIDE